MGREYDKSWFALAALLSLGVLFSTPARSDAVAVCSYEGTPVTCGSYWIDYSQSGVYALMICRGSTLESGAEFSGCVGAGGQVIYRYQRSMQQGDCMFVNNGTGLCIHVQEFPWYFGAQDSGSGAGGEDPEDPEEQEPFDVANLDTQLIAQAFAAGWSLVAMALAVGIGFTVIVNTLRRYLM